MFYTHFIQVIMAQFRDRVGIECIREKHTKPVLYLSRVSFFPDKKKKFFKFYVKYNVVGKVYKK